MRFFLLYVFYGIISIVLQTTWLANIPASFIRFDLLFVAVVTLAFTKAWKHGLPLVVFFGFLLDAASGAVFGMSVISYAFVFIGMRAIISRIDVDIGLGRFFWIATMSFAEKLICGVLMIAWTGAADSFKAWGMQFLPQALFDGIVGFVMMPALLWYSDLTWEKIFKPKKLVLR